MKTVFLYFGSFNPIHRGHLAVAEWVVEQNLCDECVLLVSPQNPLKESADLLPELERFEMAERACAASKFPTKILASCVEFLLPRPSYTIDTLRYLAENHGDGVRYALLTGADLVPEFPRWKEWETIVAKWPIYVYPRSGAPAPGAPFHYLTDAPEVPYSSTDIRALIASGRAHYQRQEWGAALNAFRRVEQMSPWYPQAAEYVAMIEEILAFRHKDFYNP